MEGKKDYKCDVCNKFYKNYKSLWKHNYIFHKVDVVEKIQHEKNVVENVVVYDNNNNNENIVDNRTCKYCNKKLCDRSYRWKHEKICKVGKLKEIENNELEEIKNKVIQLEKIIKKSGNKLNTKINTQNNNTNNGSIVNININALGNEEFMKKLSDKEKFNLLTAPLFEELPIVELVNKIYTDDKLKDDRNTKITNFQDLKVPSGACPCQSSNCLAYNNNTKKFEAVDKNKHIDKIIKCRKDDFTKLYNDRNINRKIKPQHKLIIADYMDTLENDDVKKVCKKHKKEIIYIIYNATKNIKEKLDEADALELLESSEEDKNLVV